jgi:hypothetical protein
VLVLVALAASGCTGSGLTGSGRTGSRSGNSEPATAKAPPRPADPAHTVAAQPDYSRACSPSGVDSSLTCIEVTLQAIDNARHAEGVAPMALPEGFQRLPVPEQLLVAVDRERVDRGLPPFTALSSTLSAVAQGGADAAAAPADPGAAFSHASTEWLGGATNGLDAVYSWMYDDGPGSRVRKCGKTGGSGCWSDRHLLLDDYGVGVLQMGAALNPTADTSAGDRGGPSLAAVFAVGRRYSGTLTYLWARAVTDTQAGTIRPKTAPPADRSATGIPDPPHSEPPAPDYTRSCASSGLDSASRCLQGIVVAFNAARASEGVKPLVLPAGFGTLTVAQQVLVAVNLERVDRGLPPFVGLTAALNANAQQGADKANDPPDPGAAYPVSDTEWAGGSVNGLDAVYGFMYDDGLGSGNLDCPAAGGPGCWGHRHGLLDDFGTVGTLVMGAAVNPTGDTVAGDEGGTSIAATLTITDRPPGPLVYRWAGPTG